MISIKEITNYLEELAPISSQESYDNSGLIVGQGSWEVTGVLVSLDCIEQTVDEAISKNCNLIIAHHPIVFKGLKKFNGSDYVQKTIIKAIKNDVAIYAIHTNLDNYRFGVNHEIAQRMGLKNTRVLSPKNNVLNKVVTFIPDDNVDAVSQAMFDAGAGAIGDYSECGFSTSGTGTFRPGEGTDPFIGEQGVRNQASEIRFEVIVSSHKLSRVVSAMKNSHPYEEVAFEVYTIVNSNDYEGSGMYGELDSEMSELDFLKMLKENFSCGIIRHTKLKNKSIKKVAFCGGAGSFLLTSAKNSGADIFVTGDYKYHDFFDAEDKIIIADIGHYESEQFTSNRIATILSKKFTTFAVRLTEVDTNPINYF